MQLSCDADSAIRQSNALAAQPLPLSAACYLDGQLTLRLSGMEQGVQAAAASIGGDTLADSARFWQQLREHQLAFFSGERP